MCGSRTRSSRCGTWAGAEMLVRSGPITTLTASAFSLSWTAPKKTSSVQPRSPLMIAVSCFSIITSVSFCECRDARNPRSRRAAESAAACIREQERLRGRSVVRWGEVLSVLCNYSLLTMCYRPRSAVLRLVGQVSSALLLPTLTTRPWKTVQSCAATGTGLDEGLDWYRLDSLHTYYVCIRIYKHKHAIL